MAGYGVIPPRHLETALTIVPFPGTKPEWLPILSRADAEVRLRLLVELAITEHALEAMARAGWVCKSNAELGIPSGAPCIEALPAIFSVDEQWISFRLPGETSLPFSVGIMFVVGNGTDIITDWSSSLEPTLAPTIKYAERLSEEWPL
jgi:hypothetical protein